MIKVSRGSDIPDSLRLKGAAEADEAKKYFSGKGRMKPFKFKVYSSADVKELLTRIFNSKCAYCESRFLHVYPGDVEHFRPKAAVIDKIYDKSTGKFYGEIKSEKGYYWLAADWDNLLLSCKPCNQEQTYKFPEGKTMVLGKKNQFPLKKGFESKRIKKPVTGKEKQQLMKEDNFRMIIDPCLEDPENYFIYDEHNALIMPKAASGDYHNKAETSIRVYALQRMPLVDARREIMLDIQAQQQRILELYDELAKVIDKKDPLSLALQLFYEKKLQKELAFLKDRYLRPGQAYLGMARFLINNFFKQHLSIDINSATKT